MVIHQIIHKDRGMPSTKVRMTTLRRKMMYIVNQSGMWMMSMFLHETAVTVPRSQSVMKIHLMIGMQITLEEILVMVMTMKMIREGHCPRSSRAGMKKIYFERIQSAMIGLKKLQLLMLKLMFHSARILADKRRRASVSKDLTKAEKLILMTVRKIRYLNLTGIRDLLTPLPSTTVVCTEANMVRIRTRGESGMLLLLQFQHKQLNRIYPPEATTHR